MEYKNIFKVAIAGLIIAAGFVVFIMHIHSAKPANHPEKSIAVKNKTGSIEMQSQNDFIFWESLSRHLLSITK